MSWIRSHLRHLLSYPLVALFARQLGKYELAKLNATSQRRPPMNVPVLSQLVGLIEEIFKAHGPAVVQVAEGAAVSAAVQTAEQDPKVQAMTAASVALLAAAQNLKAAINTPPAS